MINFSERYVEEIDDIRQYRGVANNVVIRVDYEPEDTTTESGIFLGSSWWDEAGHVARFGTVVSVPRRLFYRDEHKFGLEWGTVIEIKEGDVVYFGKMASYGAAILTDTNGTYYVVPYQELILKRNGESLYPLNGYIVVSRLEEGLDSKVIITPSKKHNKRKGVVQYTGRPNDFYFPKKKNIREIEQIEEGDTVLFGIAGWTELEDPRYAKLDKNLGYIHRRWIVAQLV